MFHTRGLTCQWSMKWFFGLDWKFCELSTCLDLCNNLSGDSLNIHSLQLKLNWENHPEVCVHAMALSLKAAFEQLIPDSVFPSLKQSLTQMHCTFMSPIRKWQIALNTHKINAHWEVTQTGIVADLTRLTQKIVILWHLMTGVNKPFSTVHY